MYTIGQLAKRAHVNVDSLRFYERQGLLDPARKTSSGYRLYTDEAVRRIEFIKHARRCGFSLAETRELLRIEDGAVAITAETSRFLGEKQLEITQTMAALQAMSRMLAELAAGGRTETERTLTVVPREHADGAENSLYRSL
jgi:DNA-binding transcriptional MerR regulator